VALAAPVEPAPAPPPLASAVLAASNHAAETKALSASDAPANGPRADVGRSAAASEMVDLLWFDPELPDRLRLSAAWGALVARLRPVPDEPDVDDDLPEDPPAVVDRRDVFAVITDADPTSPDDLDACLAAATTLRGAFTPPLAVLRGDLELTFDDLESLKATVAAVAPFAGGPDKRLKDAFDAVTEAMKSKLLPASGRGVESLATRLRDAFAQGNWSLPAGYLEQQIERALVEQRSYQKRALLGETWIRALVGPRGSGAPVYLPAALAEKLPLYARFPARVVVEVHLQQDQFENHPHALRCLALARVVPARQARAMRAVVAR
jgi:hypothetical protein